MQPYKDPLEILTEREVEILLLICQQLTTEEIAEKIFISPHGKTTSSKFVGENKLKKYRRTNPLCNSQ
ncbi:MAG: hypothetical protein IPO78_17015 [Saprospiraceae bacterium]|nr:hypothetical protein [Saprospiraceae bacterium]